MIIIEEPEYNYSLRSTKKERKIMKSKKNIGIKLWQEKQVKHKFVLDVHLLIVLNVLIVNIRRNNMEYNKLHNIAIQFGKTLIKKDPDLKKWVEDMLPELKESEDEKIRKELIEFVKNSCFVRTKDSKYNREQMLAWLEKQCEQKPLNEKELFKAGYTEGFEDGVRDAYIKSEEQKPVWSEEDESILQGIWDEILANKHDAKKCEWKTYDKFLDWLKSIEERVQPKQEWSKEDEEYFDDIVQSLRNLVINGGSEAKRYTEEEINWLKSLRPQSRWKPSDV